VFKYFIKSFAQYLRLYNVDGDCMNVHWAWKSDTGKRNWSTRRI